MMRAAFTKLPLVAAAITAAGSALAQSSDAATAELLFQQGRDLLRAGKHVEACPKLADSQKLDPATGTLLALAMCHQAEGKLASAWAEFTTVQAQARGENRADREHAAREQAEALKIRLSTLEIRVAPSLAALPGFAVLRDGVSLGSSTWNWSAPLDGGQHVIEVTATGKRVYRQHLTLRNEDEHQVIEIPPLEDAPAVAGPSATDRDAPASNARPTGENADRAKRWGPMEWSGVGVASAGVVVLGVGGYFLSAALGKNSDSKKSCTGNVCQDPGYADRTSAVSKGNTATLFGIAGGVLVAGGATLFIVGRSREGEPDTAHAAAPRLALGAGPQGFGAQIFGQF